MDSQSATKVDHKLYTLDFTDQEISRLNPNVLLNISRIHGINIEMLMSINEIRQNIVIYNNIVQYPTYNTTDINNMNDNQILAVADELKIKKTKLLSLDNIITKIREYKYKLREREESDNKLSAEKLLKAKVNKKPEVIDLTKIKGFRKAHESLNINYPIKLKDYKNLLIDNFLASSNLADIQNDCDLRKNFITKLEKVLNNVAEFDILDTSGYRAIGYHYIYKTDELYLTETTDGYGYMLPKEAIKLFKVFDIKYQEDIDLIYDSSEILGIVDPVNDEYQLASKSEKNIKEIELFDHKFMIVDC